MNFKFTKTHALIALGLAFIALIWFTVIANAMPMNPPAACENSIFVCKPGTPGPQGEKGDKGDRGAI